MGKDKKVGLSRLSRRDFLKISSLSAGGWAIGSLGYQPLAWGKDVFPAGKITYIVPNRVGGGHDIFARAIVPYLTKYLKELSPASEGISIVVRNEPAGGGRKGFALIFNAKPDGYTIGAMDTGEIVQNILDPADRSEFDSTKLTFLLFANSTTRLVVTSKKGFTNWNEAVEAMKKGPVKAAVGTFGNTNHVVAIYMNENMKMKFQPIVFQGSPESINALLRGDVQVAFLSHDSATSLITAGEIRPLLVMGDEPKYPGAVSLKEIGFGDVGDPLGTHRFIIATPGLEAEPKKMLLSALKKATTDPEFAAWANGADFRLTNVYGDEAEKKFKELTKFFEDFAPVLKKNLK